MNLRKLLYKLPFMRSSQETHEDVIQIAKAIGPLLDDTANDIVLKHGRVLVDEPITYIVPAVWGAKKDGELTPLQTEIHRQISPVVEKACVCFGMKGLSESQQFALGYLLRGLIISKITYMIETVNKKRIEQSFQEQIQENTLHGMETIGSA